MEYFRDSKLDYNGKIRMTARYQARNEGNDSGELEKRPKYTIVLDLPEFIL